MITHSYSYLLLLVYLLLVLLDAATGQRCNIPSSDVLGVFGFIILLLEFLSGSLFGVIVFLSRSRLFVINASDFLRPDFAWTRILSFQAILEMNWNLLGILSDRLLPMVHILLGG